LLDRSERVAIVVVEAIVVEAAVVVVVVVVEALVWNPTGMGSRNSVLDGVSQIEQVHV